MKLKKVIDNNKGSYHHIDEQGKWQSERVWCWSNGNIYYKEYFKNDKLHGICTWYKENGEINYRVYYWNNKIISKKEYVENILKLI